MIYQCPHCGGRFQIPADSSASHYSCPHCQGRVQVGAFAAESVASQTSERADVAERSKSERGAGHSRSEGVRIEVREPGRPPASPSAAEDDRDELLPPQFLVRDANAPPPGDTRHVFIPDASGRLTAIDTTVRKVELGGRVFAIRTLDEQRRARRRAIRGAVVIALSVVLLLVALWWFMR